MKSCQNFGGLAPIFFKTILPTDTYSLFVYPEINIVVIHIQPAYAAGRLLWSWASQTLSQASHLLQPTTQTPILYIKKILIILFQKRKFSQPKTIFEFGKVSPPH